MKHLMALGLTLLVGCEAAKQETPITADNADALVAGCVSMREKAASCRAEIVDDWIAVKAQYNPDIAEELRSNKAGITKVALDEFEQDGTGDLAPREKACRDIVENAPPAAVALGQKFAACDQTADCTSWKACVLPVLDEMEQLRTGGKRPG